MSLEWTTKTLTLSELKPYSKNPRKISKQAFEQLKASLKQDGYHQRLVADVDGTIVGGHQRLKALKELGIKDVEVLTPSRKLTEEEFDRINIRDNLPFGDFDTDLLAEHFDPDKLLEWGMPEEWLPKQEDVVNEPEGDEDEAGALPDVPKTIRGDIYQIGPHRLMCGDSTLIDDVDKLMGGVKADMVFTDPPYGVSYDGGHATEKRRTKLENDDKTLMYDGAMPVAYAASKTGAALYLWFADRFSREVLNALDQCGYKVRNWIIWNKNLAQFGAIGAQYKSKHEPCIYAFKDGHAPFWSGPNNEVTVWDVTRHSKNEFHPTQKPVELVERALNNSSKSGDTILDLFGGSGSTMVAAHKLGRTAYLMELDEKYCDVIVCRMRKLFPALAVTRNGEPFDG